MAEYERGSVMVWDRMSAQGVGNLHFFDAIMNQLFEYFTDTYCNKC